MKTRQELILDFALQLASNPEVVNDDMHQFNEGELGLKFEEAYAVHLFAFARCLADQYLKEI